MKYLLFFFLFFSLPHSKWILFKFNISPESIPLGIVNLVLLSAVLLFLFFREPDINKNNYFKYYARFLFIVVLYVFVGGVTGFEADFLVSLTDAKREITLLLLYFVPLYVIKDSDDFLIFFIITLSVHLLIGYEVLSSGVLGGTQFHDGKRGSGPFSLGYTGSDVAGSFLAQAVMFFVGILFFEGVGKFYRGAAVFATGVLFLGIVATYARGALLSCTCGLLFILIARGMSLKFLLIPLLLISVGVVFMPESMKTRFAATTAEDGSFDEATQGRFFYYEAAFEILKENPFGVGTGQIRAAMKEKTGKYVDPHNGLLFTAIEYGIFGTIVFVLMLIQFFKYSKEVTRDSSCPLIYRIYCLGMAGFIGSLIGCNVFYANFYKEIVLGTIAIHLGMLAFIANDEFNKTNNENH